MSAMLDDANMMYLLYPFFHLALLNDFVSFALWISVKLHESTHWSTAFPSSSVVVYPYVVLWLLKSPITMSDKLLCPSVSSTIGSVGGLYTECTATPGISTP